MNIIIHIPEHSGITAKEILLFMRNIADSCNEMLDLRSETWSAILDESDVQFLCQLSGNDIFSWDTKALPSLVNGVSVLAVISYNRTGVKKQDSINSIISMSTTFRKSTRGYTTMKWPGEITVRISVPETLSKDIEWSKMMNTIDGFCSFHQAYYNTF